MTHITDREAIRWAPVASNRYYEVSTDGVVRRAEDGRELKPTPTPSGYLQVCLCFDGRQTYRQVSHLVAEAFIGPRPPGMFVCHNNGVRDDNRLENLRYDTQKGNMADCIAHGTSNRGTANGHARLDVDQVCEIRRLIASGRGNREIAPMFGVHHAHISAIRRRVKWAWLDADPSQQSEDVA